MTAELFVAVTKEKIKSGAPIPIPKATKLRMLFIKPVVDTVARVKSAMMKAGLHGITIAPKKKPNKNALFRGL